MDEETIESPKIALAFSGGGFRAAGFCLGTLSYLDRLKLGEKTMLECVVALSTVSGGTITGTRYAVGKANGESTEVIYKSIYEFLAKVDLVSLALDRLTSDEHWQGRVKSLINSFADVYNEKFFHDETFASIINPRSPLHLNHISFNSTEFTDGLQFRFQWTEKINSPRPGEPDRGIIGNSIFRLSEEAAKEIRMGHILAASSCFPGGFEPINFPSDFLYKGSRHLAKLTEEEKYPVGLMDGGIVDNQGIEPILLAEKRMKRNSGNDETQLDLIIIADVASPFMEEYKASEQHPAKGWRSWTPSSILITNTVLLVLSISGLYWSIQNLAIVGIIVSSAIVTLTLIVYLFGRMLKKLPVKFQVPPFFLRPLGKFLRLRLQVYENLVMNRTNSLLKLANEVFLKHVRRLNYANVFDDHSWKNRRIMNAIYELKWSSVNLKKKIEDEHLPAYLIPSSNIQEVATTAASMGTTLWFTPDELKKRDMLNSLIATGQFTMCWNLLEYIEKLKLDRSNTNPQHQMIMQLEKQLRQDWITFNANPKWMV
jgi:predicted acylesterase/phospholipase RssA